MTPAFRKIMTGLKDALAHAKGGKGAASTTTTTLSAADWQQLQEALAHPPAPNAALKEAFDRYKQSPAAKAPKPSQP